MLPRTSEFYSAFKETYDRFHSDAYNGRQNARGILKEMEVLIRKHYVSRGIDPEPVLRKLSAVDTILYKGLSERGTARGLDRTLRELSLAMDQNKTKGSNVVSMLNEYMREFSTAWREFNAHRSDESYAETVHAILDDITDLAPAVARFQLRNKVDGLYSLYHEASVLSGKIRQAITAVGSYQTLPKDVHKDAGNFMAKLNEIVTYRPELLHIPATEKTEEEDTTDLESHLQIKMGRDGQVMELTDDVLIKMADMAKLRKKEEAEKVAAAGKGKAAKPSKAPELEPERSGASPKPEPAEEPGPVEEHEPIEEPELEEEEEEEEEE